MGEMIPIERPLEKRSKDIAELVHLLKLFKKDLENWKNSRIQQMNERANVADGYFEETRKEIEEIDEELDMANKLIIRAANNEAEIAERINRFLGKETKKINIKEIGD